ncbi:Ni/Fe-hydrogenase, b-type cytochrome subunit [Beggiatoa leptomitoformis]|uniref:Ni/Fe-hydrogenase, b-type cytochrome subunit n=1 Tax=Beggiatoa leptomitoformis TaxID=288004 RepID=A0A2N9YCE0_9GAMM|nr:Ni/Fe-hydrogenase, b-type cytochrome subunit [Beggiatoa leptomitoformis]ALG66597.1 Ni/Fe-hydrogenase, b-type cytochrome subunit [Beggiatoa leptomitoformis]AUI68094.1 Ni/Fe-hydrogenase, b-type cytochrome subunit [Beggiatoa leptomitoformis]
MTTSVETKGKFRYVQSIYVYETPVRLWHWLNALCITILMITGYLISHPLPSIGGEASEHFVMGYIRFTHFATAYIFTIGFFARIYWAFFGNHHSRQLFILPIFNLTWWSEVIYELRWYFFLAKEPKKYVGHNPLAQLAMFFFITLGSPFMMLTGFALYAEGTGAGSWQDVLFGWVIPLFGQSQDVHTFHQLGMWAVLIFVMIHIYAAIREDIMSRQSLVSTMISGYRMFKDSRD